MDVVAKPSVDNMVQLPGGAFLMGSDHHYPEERPQRWMKVDGFQIDRYMVTNRSFRQFVEATGHVTLAEVPPRVEDYPGAHPAMLRPASLVFISPTAPVPMSDHHAWWSWTFGANWRHPEGPGSSIDGLEDHPVVHVAHTDAIAYAQWAGKALPTEAEWEYAARGGLLGKEFAWGDEFVPPSGHQANLWQGDFPYRNTLEDGFARTSPVGSFPPNGFGLYDMIGNAWEWTADRYDRAASPRKGCCAPKQSRATRPGDDPGKAQHDVHRHVLKGGSHLCAPNYCRRYRPAARHAQPVDSPTSHIGFRCIIRS